MKHGRVAVVGGGIAGLAAAWEFASATPLDVTVFETSERARRPDRRDGLRRARHDRQRCRRLPRPCTGRDGTGGGGRPRRRAGVARTGARRGLVRRRCTGSPTASCSACPGISHRSPRPGCSPGGARPAPRSNRSSPGRRSTPTRSGGSSAPGSATRCRNGSSMRSSAASTPPTPTGSASARCHSCTNSPSSERSLLLAARRRGGSGTGTAASGPIFAAPRGGLAQLVAATADAVTGAGGSIRTSAPVDRIERRDGGRDGRSTSVASRSMPSSSPRPPGARPHSSPTARPRAVTCSAAPRPPTSSWSRSTYRPTSGPSGCTA